MGICDLVPGISGGTIAFITGIYERLINAVNGFSLKLVYDFLRGDWKEFRKDVQRLDLGFLIILIFGVLTAILLGSRVIKFLLENFMSYTLSFFIGLIIASSFIIFENIKNHNFNIEIDDILKELAYIGFGRIDNVVKVETKTGKRKVIVGENEDGSPKIEDQEFEYQDVIIKDTEGMEDKDKAMVAGIKQGRNGIELKTNDKIKALELLGRYKKMFTDKVEHSGEVKHTLTLEEADKLIQEAGIDPDKV